MGQIFLWEKEEGVFQGEEQVLWTFRHGGERNLAHSPGSHTKKRHIHLQQQYLVVGSSHPSMGKDVL